MSRNTGKVIGMAFAAAVWLSWSPGFAATAQPAPNFAPSPDIGWYAFNRQFIAPQSGAGPVQQDPGHPYVSNDEFRVSGKQPTDQMADLGNPILQPWAREVLSKRNAIVLAGKPAPPPHASCWPVGVPGFILRPMTEPMFFIQTPTEVVMILSSKQEIRHIYLNAKHSAKMKPSWYGESVGHYEGDTLVVDTIGIDKRTWVDGFGTPHSPQLHVVERFHLTGNGEVLQADVHVEDPGAFTRPWNAIQRFRQYEAAVRKMPIDRIAQLASVPEGPLREMICADNPNSFFEGVTASPLPQAVASEF